MIWALAVQKVLLMKMQSLLLAVLQQLVLLILFWIPWMALKRSE